MKPNRTLRVGQLLRRELAELFQEPKLELKQDLITVTEVRLTGDLKHAKVWVSILGAPERRRQVIEKLQLEARRIRFMLADRVRIRRMPELTFDLDETLDHADRIEELLKQSKFGDADESNHD